jgi:hypothetical protein
VFVYETISESDIDRFDLYKNEGLYGLSKSPLRWAFDRESDSYLRRTGSDREVPNRDSFEFHWRGESRRLVFDLQIDHHPEFTQFTWSPPGGLSTVEDGNYLAALKGALTAYGHGQWDDRPGAYKIAFAF